MNTVNSALSRTLRLLISAAIGLGAAVPAASGSTCIVSGTTSRTAAESASSVMGEGTWFDSCSFFVAVETLEEPFDSYAPGAIIVIR